MKSEWLDGHRRNKGEYEGEDVFLTADYSERGWGCPRPDLGAFRVKSWPHVYIRRSTVR